MSVFSKIQGFLSRHRNKFVVSGIIIGGSILLTRYAQQKLKQWQEKEAFEFLERNRKLQHFESIGRTGNQTILNLSIALNETLASKLDTDALIEGLKHNPSNKLELWNDLKILVFTKAACSIYCSSMLVVCLKIQLSILGGYLYKDPNCISSELQEAYLSLCQNLLNSGFRQLYQLVEAICKRVMESVELNKQLKLSDLEAIFWSIQTAVATDKNNPVEQLRHYILPTVPDTAGVYKNIIRDTIDFLESDEVKSLTTHCTNKGFMVLSEQLAEFYKENGKSPQPGQFVNPFNVKKPLAKVIPIVNGLFSKKSMPDRFLQQLISHDKLHILSANVYESLL